MLAILSDRNRIMQKHEMEETNMMWKQLMMQGFDEQGYIWLRLGKITGIENMEMKVGHGLCMVLIGKIRNTYTQWMNAIEDEIIL